MTAMLEAALEYARRGIPVFPVKPKGMAPLTRKGFKDATTDEKQILAWWEKWPNANIGLVPGPANLVVVDYDGEEGLEFARERGWLEEETPSVVTDRGRHFYYTKPPDSHIRYAQPHPQIDLRSDNGYVLAPPSIHPSGHVYVWENEELEFAPLPEDMLRAVKVRQLTKGQGLTCAGGTSQGGPGLAGLVSAETLAPYLGVSTARLYQLARDQIVPPVRVGRSVKFDLDQIREWIEGGGSSLPGGWRKEPLE